MKKTYIVIGTLLLCSGLMAQTPANRTSKTVAADVLAQMPANEQQSYNELIGQLSQAGEGAVQTLIGMMNPPGKGDNAKIDYALSGLSHFVMAKGNETARLMVSNVYQKALDHVTDREIKAFLIRQLQIMGGDEAIETLANYLNDEALSGPAARALSCIGTQKAGEALISSLKRRMGTAKTQCDAMNAIAEMKVKGTDEVLLPFIDSSEESIRQTALYALSQSGSLNVIDRLADKASEVEYAMDKTGATEAYIAFLKRMSNEVPEEISKAAKKLQKEAGKAGQEQTREAALQIQLSTVKRPKDVTKLICSALKDKSKNYRNAALTFAADYADVALYTDIIKSIKKAPADTKVDILTWLGREAKSQNKEIISTLMYDADLLPCMLLTEELQEGEPSVQQAAAWTMVKTGNQIFVPVLTHLLTSTDKQQVLLGQDALLAFPGDISNSVNEAIKAAPDEGKIAGVEILAMRKDDSKMQTVLELTNNASDKVKDAAYAALKDLATSKDYRILYSLLMEETDKKYIKPLQNAVTAALNTMEKGGKQWEEAINEIKNEKNKKYLFYPILASTGEQDALDILIEGYNKDTGETQNAALEALLSWSDLRVSDFLYNIAKTEAPVSVKALQRYIELIAASNMTGENKLLRLRKAMDVAKESDLRNLILQKVQDTGTFLALLYAGNFLEEKAVQQSAANAVMNIALGHPEYTGQNVRALLERVMQVLDNPDAHYQIEGIKKHLAEMPDEIGFVSMFNGKDLSGWKGLVENPIARAKMSPNQLKKAQIKADEQMRKDWKVENGCLVFEGEGFDNLCTEKQYGDFEMYVEWMLDPAGPEADAGIYLRGTPQVQIWDTARVNVGAQVGSGGLYNNQQNLSKPIKVADNKLGEWNTFYIKMVGDRVTVDLNGERVVDNVILENYWDRNQPIFPLEQIELQAHGSKCSFRNLYIKELKRIEPFQLSETEKKEGFKILFDGTNMYEWTGNTGDYVLDNGCISMEPSRSFGGNLYTKNEYANFIYRFEFQLTPGANNGVGLRTPLEGDAAYVGMESQILDCEHPIYSTITPLQHHGSIYGIIPANEKHIEAMKPTGEWNYEEIICDGDNIKVTLNGIVIVEGNIRDATKNGTPDKQEHPGLFNKKGHIGFLGHGSPIKFRNIRIKELK